MEYLVIFVNELDDTDFVWCESIERALTFMKSKGCVQVIDFFHIEKIRDLINQAPQNKVIRK